MRSLIDASPFAVAPGGVRLCVRLTPRAGRTAVDGIVCGSDGKPALHVKVTAPPAKGAANAALIALLADALKLPKSQIHIVSGETARLKILALSGDADAIAARLRDWIAAGGGRRDASG